MRKTVFNTMQTLGYNSVVAILTLSSSIFIARALGPELKGIYSLFIFIPALLFTIGHLGINLATNFYIANQRLERKQVINTSVIISLILGVVSALFGYLVHLILKDNFLPGTSELLFVIVLLVVPVQIVFSSLDNVLLGMKDIGSFNKFYSIRPFLNLLFLIVFYLLFQDKLFWFALAWLLSQLLPLPFLVSKIRKLSPFSFNFYDNPVARKLFKFGLKNYLNYIVLYLEFKIDLFLIYAFLDPTSVGLYSIAVAGAEASTALIGAVNTVIFPSLAGAKKNIDTKRLKRFSIYFSLIASAGFSLILIVLAPWLVDFLFGAAFHSSIQPLQILAVAIVFSNLRRTLMNNFSAEEKAHLNNWVNVPSLLLNLALNIILIPALGIAGAAYASLISYALSAFAMVILYFKDARA